MKRHIRKSQQAFMHTTIRLQLNIFLAILVDAYAKVKADAEDSGSHLFDSKPLCACAIECNHT
jgi:hypothetical protein